MNTSQPRLVVLSGAGMSAESGIATFRGAGGLWEGHRVEEVASPEGFAAQPELVLEFYNQRRRQIVDARPKRPKYDKGHIPMAVSIPDTQFDKMTAQLPQDKNALLIFYCGGPT